MLSVSEGCGSDDPGLRLGLTDGHWGIRKRKIASAGELPFSKRKTCILEYGILLLSDAQLQLLIQQDGHE